jgi:exopolysaccharide biosynthesis polyprenyl glycosylphosphotransferase
MSAESDLAGASTLDGSPELTMTDPATWLVAELDSAPPSLLLPAPERRRDRPALRAVADVVRAPAATPLLDAAALIAAVVVVALLAADSLGAVDAVAFVATTLAAAYFAGAYAFRLRGNALETVGRVMASTAIGAVAVVLLRPLIGDDTATASIGALWLAGCGAMLLGRLLRDQLLAALRRHGLASRRTLIIGTGEVGVRLGRRLAAKPEYGLEPVGYLDDVPPIASAQDASLRLLGGRSELRRVIHETGAELVLVAFSRAGDRALLPVVRECAALGVQVSVVPRVFDAVNDRVTYQPIGGLPVVTLTMTDPHGWRFTVKHALDRLVAGAMLLALAPLLAVVAFAIRRSSPGPIFFRQQRVGRDGQVFEMLKFRSMRLDDGDGSFVPVAGSAPGGIEGIDRRTSIGRWLRRTSFDELPQLLNVLRGEMSLVGPRPERPHFVSMFIADYARYDDRHRVRAGLTGLSQVSGLRGAGSLEDRVELDNWYIEHFGLRLDLIILLRTIVAVLRSAE